MEIYDYSYLTLEECYFINLQSKVSIVCDGNTKKLILRKE